MKIIFFYTYNQSFLSSFFKELSIQLIEGEYDIKIVSLKEKSELLEVAPGLSVQILKKRSKWLNYISIFKLLMSEKPDVVISNFSYVNPAILSGKLLGIKKNIVWFHTVTQALNPSKNQVRIKSIFLKQASEIIVNSESLKGDLEHDYSISKTKIFPIPFWSSLEASHTKSEVFKKKSLIKIGCPGRIEEVKNQQLIIDSLVNVEERISWRLYIAGSGSNEESLRLKVRQLNLEDKVDFLGVLSIDKMKEYYEEIDLIILPSKFEAFGLVLIEALSMGCPVLVSESFGALGYIKDGEFLNKYSFNPHSSVDLSAKLNNVIANKEHSSDYFRNIYTTYFQKEKIIAKVEEVINL
ncbi:glycosyltransferase family 1 protein [Aequorivita sp. H23M31]|uniref:Glycosyltransferase family 1 protein n=1 Tax=Aequorivita ciconiae TaxID=2494375 RepID=A0A410G260_9FLAO|nr:glycosyltransferase family 4 protein [Aequorivita sp. H23M31]QAA81356.1 glycosyltransferase family 1 protein [Aequorivita sp. H23M31]